jgi:NTP pyrophosphatase (non-canonical NTP hydrolase)
MLLDKKMLINFILDLKGFGFDEETIKQIKNEINDGAFDSYDPNLINKRMKIFERISIERERQDDLHEFPTEIRLAVLTEEVGEIAKELQERHYEGKDKFHLIIELIQTAAVCVRWIEELEKEMKL